jgi:hypothetical protein
MKPLTNQAVTTKARRKIMKATRITLTLGILSLAVGSALAQKVTNDYDQARDCSKSKTYAWVKGTPAKS